MNRRWEVLAVLTSIALTGLLYVVPTAQARDAGSLTIEPSDPHVEKSYPSFTAQYPYLLFAGIEPDVCRVAEYCDTIALTIGETTNLSEVNIVEIQLMWNVDDDNDMDLFLWEEDQSTRTGTAATASNDPPERISISEPIAGLRYLTIVNWGLGVNTGYTIILDWTTEELPPPPHFEVPRPPPPGDTKFGPGNLPPAGLDPGSLGEGASGSEGETRTILVPGPDGELVEMEVPVYAGARRDEDVEGNLLIPVIAAVILLAASGGGFAFFRMRRREEPGSP